MKKIAEEDSFCGQSLYYGAIVSAIGLALQTSKFTRYALATREQVRRYPRAVPYNEYYLLCDVSKRLINESDNLYMSK